MDFKINDNNLEQWCFDYLENQLNAEDKRFFEQALEFDTNINAEFQKWQKTMLQDLSDVNVNPQLSKTILHENKSKGVLKKVIVGSLAIFCIGSAFWLFKPKQNIEIPAYDYSNEQIQTTDTKERIEAKVLPNDSTKAGRKKASAKRKSNSSSTEEPAANEPIKKTINEVSKPDTTTSEKKVEVKQPIQNVPLSTSYSFPLPTRENADKEKKRTPKKFIEIHDQL